ncbi:hypothetical protein C8R46DRAFT_1307817 [Mycena filopes]|nr:hypothetical protein C8R46DRAFT_1307817 [Mycena filopes]
MSISFTRRKKKRCDGQYPCRTCSSGRKKIPCEYPEGIVVGLPTQTAAEVVSVEYSSPDSNSGSSSSTGTNSSETPAATSTSTVATDSAKSSSTGVESYPTNYLTLSEISHARKLFIDHRRQLGLGVRDETLAILADGVANETLHSSVLHACQLLGYMLARHLQDNTWVRLPDQSEREAAQMRLTLNALQHAEIPPLAALQSATLLSFYFFSKGDIVRAREMVLTGNAIVRERDLDAVVEDPTPPAPGNRAYGFKVAPTTDAGELQAAVSQLVYLDLSYAITLQIPSLLDAELRDRFRTLISRPNVNAESNFIRAKSAFLLFEAQQIVARWYQEPALSFDEGAEWQSKYWDNMEALDTHRAYISVALAKLAFCPRLHNLGLTLKVCAVMLHTGVSALFTIFAADYEELRDKKHAAVGEIIAISSTFTEEDCKYLDPILSACWTSIIGTLDHCISLGAGAIEQSMHDIPAMAGVIRQRNRTLQRVLPFAVDV